MTEKEKIVLKEKITHEIARLRKDLVPVEELAKAHEVEDSDEVTRMESLMSKRFNEAAFLALENRCAALEYALKRIDDPEFGFCMECGEAIGIARLMAMPETTMCIDCAN